MLQCPYKDKGSSLFKMEGCIYKHQLDAKNRMRIPAKIREELGEGYYVSVGSGGCLYVYTKQEMEILQEKLSKLNSFGEKQLKGARLITYNSWQVVEDKQGRLRLPDNLLQIGKIKKNIIVAHGPTNVEIWSEEVWNEYFNDVNLEDVASALELLNQ